METQPAILIYEDDEACGLAFATILRRAGYHVTVANHFNTALQALEAAAPVDLLLADIVMPAGGVHGFALARMARARRPAIKVLHCTGFDLDASYNDGRYKILRKPISDEQLLSAVGRALDC